MLRLDEVGRLVEIPVEDLRNVGPFAQVFLQDAEERDLPLEAGKLLGREAELADVGAKAIAR